jgi:hypothetical protein
MGEYENVVQVGETEVESPQDVVHEALEGFGGSLLYIGWMDGNFVVCSHQIDFGEDRTTEKLVRVVVDMADGIAVGNGACVERSVVAAGSPRSDESCRPATWLRTRL